MPKRHATSSSAVIVCLTLDNHPSNTLFLSDATRPASPRRSLVRAAAPKDLVPGGEDNLTICRGEESKKRDGWAKDRMIGSG